MTANDEPAPLIAVLLIDPDGSSRFAALPPGDHDAWTDVLLRELGGGSAVEEAGSGDGWVAYVNGDGHALRHKPNPVASSLTAGLGAPHGPLVGTIAFFGQDGEDVVATPQWLVAMAPQPANAVVIDGAEIVPLGSGESVHHSTIFGGESFSPAEPNAADELARASGLPRNVTSAQAAMFVRRARAEASAAS